MPHPRISELKKMSGRRSLLAAELTDAEIELIKKSKVETSLCYELDDLDDNGERIEKITSRFGL